MQSGYTVFHFTKWSEWEWSSGSFGVELLSLKHERKNLFHSFSRCVQLLTQSLNNFHPIMKILPLSLETPRSQIIITIFRPTSDIICFSHFYLFFFFFTKLHLNFEWVWGDDDIDTIFGELILNGSCVAHYYCILLHTVFQDVLMCICCCLHRSILLNIV